MTTSPLSGDPKDFTTAAIIPLFLTVTFVENEVFSSSVTNKMVISYRGMYTLHENAGFTFFG
ncbi:MAG: hypothetical protein LBJ67_14000 [Planctomycetaceae bacterium]|jgi:hypothetical protein|nr:hypothetical protein [Planctomycetaceae bacterium]